MTPGIIITAIVCVTIVAILIVSELFATRSKPKEEYEYRVVHIEYPRGINDAIEKGIVAATHVFPGEVVAVCNDPYYPDMKSPMYSVVIRSPKRSPKRVKKNEQ